MPVRRTGTRRYRLRPGATAVVRALAAERLLDSCDAYDRVIVTGRRAQDLLLVSLPLPAPRPLLPLPFSARKPQAHWCAARDHPSLRSSSAGVGGPLDHRSFGYWPTERKSCGSQASGRRFLVAPGGIKDRRGVSWGSIEVKRSPTNRRRRRRPSRRVNTS
jgi:hypothetical protein